MTAEEAGKALERIQPKPIERLQTEVLIEILRKLEDPVKANSILFLRENKGKS